MHIIISIIFYLLIVTMVIYSCMLLWLIIGNIFFVKPLRTEKLVPISIIIAVRNGEKSLHNLISDLSAQDYLGDMEFILVDDVSEDTTKTIICAQSSIDNRFIYESSENGYQNLRYKKRALDAGISRAKNEWLLFTDVDCRLRPGWVRTMASYCREDIDFIVGFSNTDRGNRLVTHFQHIDLLMLMIAARGTANLGVSWASTGQNQAFRKSLFHKVGGYSLISKELQGDDTLFLQICRYKATTKVVFADNWNCRVFSRQENKWGSFLRQRIRWAGDVRFLWRLNNIFFLEILVTFILSTLVCITLYSGFFNSPKLFSIWIILIAIKFFNELLLYCVGVYQLEKSIKLIDFIQWCVLYPHYIMITGIGSILSKKPSWRGR